MFVLKKYEEEEEEKEDDNETTSGDKEMVRLLREHPVLPESSSQHPS